jgi:hypothetical protein
MQRWMTVKKIRSETNVLLTVTSLTEDTQEESGRDKTQLTTDSSAARLTSLRSRKQTTAPCVPALSSTYHHCRVFFSFIISIYIKKNFSQIWQLGQKNSPHQKKDKILVKTATLDQGRFPCSDWLHSLLVNLPTSMSGRYGRASSSSLLLTRKAVRPGKTFIPSASQRQCCVSLAFFFPLVFRIYNFVSFVWTCEGN